MCLCCLRYGQCRVERIVLCLVHRAVDVCCLTLPIAGGAVRVCHVDARCTYERSHRIIEIEGVIAEEMRNLVRKSAISQRTRSDNHNTVLCMRDLCDLLMMNVDIEMLLNRVRDIGTEPRTIHGKCPTGRNGSRVCRPQDERTEMPHLFLEDADGILKPSTA